MRDLQLAGGDCRGNEKCSKLKWVDSKGEMRQVGD